MRCVDFTRGTITPGSGSLNGWSRRRYDPPAHFRNIIFPPMLTNQMSCETQIGGDKVRRQLHPEIVNGIFMWATIKRLFEFRPRPAWASLFFRCR